VAESRKPGSRSLVVFTDGAARQNPGPGGWGAIVLRPSGEVVELGGRAPRTTNNRMELTAAIAALEEVRDDAGEVELHTDSTYLIRGIREWVRRWKRNGWRTAEGKDVLNRDLWGRLDRLIAQRGGESPVHWLHVPGHSGVPGNERADAIATALADGEAIDLYRGPRSRYGFAVDGPIPEARRSLPARRGGGSSRAAKPHSYLSLVGGKPMRHATWADCELRVKGVSGARFKKAMSAADEAVILASWGYSPRDLER
jgi:ribonuclease HI